MKQTTAQLHDINSHVESVAWPSFTSGKPAVLASLLHYLDRSQWFTRETLEQCQHLQLVLLAEYAFAQSPYFRSRMEAAGLKPRDLGTPQGFVRLPVMTRRDMKAAGNDLYCKTIPASHRPHGSAITSGSTGEPVKVQKTAINSILWQANMMRDHFWNQRNFDERLLVIRSSEIVEVTEQEGWGQPVGLLFPSGRARVVPITTDLKDQIRHILEFKPQHLLVYPNNLNALISLCEQEKIAIDGISHIWCYAETLTPRIRKRAEEFFGARVEDSYSSQEMGIMAMQCPESRLYHVTSESVILEVLDENDKPCSEGQTGRVVVTDLHNFATPVIRYAVGDYAQMGGACSCGRGLHTLNAIFGRERNLISKPGGVRHWPRLNLDESDVVGNVIQYQIIQHTLEEIEVRMVVTPRLTDEEEAKLTAHLQEHMGHPFRFRYSYFEGRLPLPANGKFEEFISHCS